MFSSFISGLNPDLLSHTARSHDTARMAKIIDAECETDDGPKVAWKHKRKPKKMAVASDVEDNNFVESSSDSDSTSQSEDSDGVEITNEEVSVTTSNN